MQSSLCALLQCRYDGGFTSVVTPSVTLGSHWSPLGRGFRCVSWATVPCCPAEACVKLGTSRMARHPHVLVSEIIEALQIHSWSTGHFTAFSHIEMVTLSDYSWWGRFWELQGALRAGGGKGPEVKHFVLCKWGLSATSDMGAWSWPVFIS